MSVAAITFKKYDKDNSGTIDKEEFKSLCYELGHKLSEQELSLALQVNQGHIQN